MNVTIDGPDDARIVLKVHEPDGSTASTVLWGPGTDAALRDVVRAALAETEAAAADPAATRTLGEIDVDDRLRFQVDGVEIDAATAGARLAAFVVRAVLTTARRL